MTLESELIREAIRRDIEKSSREELQGYVLRVWDMYQKERSHSQWLATKLERSSRQWFYFSCLWILVAALAVLAGVFDR